MRELRLLSAMLFVALSRLMLSMSVAYMSHFGRVVLARSA